MTTETRRISDGLPAPQVAATPFTRLQLGQTAADFWGGRKRWFALSLVLLAISAVSLSTRWLNPGIDFEGGTAFDVPAGAAGGFDVDDARAVLDDQGVSSAEVTLRRSPAGELVKVQIEDTSDEVGAAVRAALAASAGVDVDAVGVSAVSSSWGSDLARTALIAAAVIVGVMLVVIAVRHDWRAALSALAAMIHDVAIVGGLYSLLGLEVTSATVVAFLAALGYSLYDTLVVFDRMSENERRIVAAGLGAADLVNVSSNQVLMRSLTTSVGVLTPIAAVLVVGGLLLGQATLRDFTLVLFVAVLVGAYSSICVATPLLGWLKGAGDQSSWLTGEELRHLVVRGVAVLSGRAARPGRRRETAAAAASAAARPRSAPTVEASPEQLLSHPPRPRKKKRH